MMISSDTSAPKSRFLCRDAEWRFRFYGGTPHVADGYLRDAIRLADEVGLRPLPRTSWAEQYGSHDCRQKM